MLCLRLARSRARGGLDKVAHLPPLHVSGPCADNKSRGARTRGYSRLQSRPGRDEERAMTSTVVLTYRNVYDFQTDVGRMARHGYRVVSSFQESSRNRA